MALPDFLYPPKSIDNFDTQYVQGHYPIVAGHAVVPGQFRVSRIRTRHSFNRWDKVMIFTHVVPDEDFGQDGGGVRGLSSLYIIREILQRLQQNTGLPSPPLANEVFHMAGGTGTGG